MLIYEPHIMPDPLIPFIFHKDVRSKGERTSPNWHTNIELLYCVDGEGYVNCEGTAINFRAGEVFVVSSNKLHEISTNSEIHYHCFIPDREFCETNGVPTDGIAFQEIISNKSFTDVFDKLVEAYEYKGICRAAVIRHAVLGLLVDLKRFHISAEDSIVKDDNTLSLERVKKTMVYVRQNLSHTLILDEIANYVGISKYYLTREFKSITGQTVFEYVNIVRCKEAKRLIQGGMTVAEAADSCGFDNMSYFSRTYKKCIGELPSTSRANQKKQK